MARQARRQRTVLEPIGEVRRFELPFTAAPGRLIKPEIGLCSIALRSGEHKPYTIDVTVLDAPDLRLVRAGVWLAHRVVDGRGEWYLASDQWAPWLPTERVEQMGDVDLPETFADLVRPFRRGAPLGPVVALTCDREEFTLRGDRAELLAVLRDDRVQVRSSGVVTASYREVTIAGVEDRLQSPQITWLTEVLCGVGASRVLEFPTLAQRIGAPATGLSDFPPPRDCKPGDSLEQVWSYRIGRRMREVTHADLALRARAPGAHQDLVERLREIRAQFLGFIPLLDPAWARDLVAELDGLLAELADPDRADTVVNGERYLRVLDRLVSAVRAPALGGQAAEPAGVALAGELGARLGEFVIACDALGMSAEDSAWQSALAAAAGVIDSCHVQIRPSARVGRIGERAARLARRLVDCVRVTEEYAGLDVGSLTSREAFAAGRRFERLFADQGAARTEFLARWARQRPRLVRDAEVREEAASRPKAGRAAGKRRSREKR
ncbi:hypothetical protein [Granulicoccus sp. GXG6511]|uniref:hypothetical protein n=1 Tax=Granulicoccus sp. GXG6511 TaxID=3381351 RepID=UPI003D7E0E31